MYPKKGQNVLGVESEDVKILYSNPQKALYPA